MANTFVNPTVVAKECVRQLKNNCVMAGLVHRGYEEEFKMLHRGWKPGSTIQVKAPVYFRTHTERDISVAGRKVDLFEQQSTFEVNSWRGVAFKINSEEATQNIDIFTERFITPAMQAIADDIDRELLGLYAGVCNQVGEPYKVPQSLMPYLEAHARLTEHSVPLQNRSCVINPYAKIHLANVLTHLFNQPMVGTAVERAKFGDIAGFTMYESQSVRTHVPGTAAGGYHTYMSASSTDGDTTLLVDENGTWSDTLTPGDICIVISPEPATVNACNPISGQDLGYARQFVVNSHTDEGDYATLGTTPGAAPFNIRSSASTATYLPYQTMTHLPAEDEPLIIAGTASLPYNVNLTFHKDAFGMVMLPIELPLSINWKAVMSYDGYTVSVSRYFDGDTLDETVRFDVLFGTKILNPFMACRIAG